MSFDYFLEQGEHNMEDYQQDRYENRGISTNIVQGAYMSRIRRMDMDPLREPKHPMMELTEGIGRGCAVDSAILVPSQFLVLSRRRSSTVLHVALFILMTASCASATWEDFANNLGSDLAPLLALFGEQVTRQYLSESYSLLDSFVFALAPLGIITAIVAAIRVGGSANFRSLIGRATESSGTVEADLMSSTSSDVCELWNGKGVVRVLGSPVLLQLIHVESEKRGDKAGIYTLLEATRMGHYKNLVPNNELDPDTEAFLARQNPPSLSLNVSIDIKRRRSIARAIAPVGVLLQSGVVIFAAVTQYKPGILKGNKPLVYGFPMFLAGTLGLAVGMFLCAQVVETSTDETTHEPSKALVDDGSNSTIWLQQGGQTVGDQLFGSFARRRPATTILTSQKSEKDRNPLVIVAVSTALFGFIAQFVGLRAMHATVTVTQLGAILVMTALRSFAHMQRQDKNDIKSPDQVGGHELDWLAKELNGCEVWEVASGFDKPLTSEGNSNLAMDVMRSRARLVALSEDWKLENRSRAEALQTAIERTMNYAFAKMTIKDNSREKHEFQWSLPVMVRFGGETSIFPTTLSLKRKEDDGGGWGPWSADVSELEAVLCLWTSSLTEAKRERAKACEPALKNLRLNGVATDESKIDHRLWINRGTAFKEIPGPTPTTPNTSRSQYFGWTGPLENTNSLEGPSMTKFVCVDCKQSLEKLCTQDLYGWFIFNLVKVIEKVGGTTTPRSNEPAMEEAAATTIADVRNNGWDKFRLINSNLSSLVACYTESGLGTIEEAYFCLVPALRIAGNLPFPHEAYNRARVEARRLEKDQWEQSLEISWWLYHNSRKTGASELDISSISNEVGGCLRRLVERIPADPTKDSFCRIWDAVYSGWERISKASEDKFISLLRLSITCPKVKRETEQLRLFHRAFETLQTMDVRVLRLADIVLNLAQLALDNEFLEAAETLAKFVWTETAVPWSRRGKTRNWEASILLMNTYQNKGVPLLNKLDQESMQLAVQTDISNGVSALEIRVGQVSIEQLVMRGYRTPLQWAAGDGRVDMVQHLLDKGADVNAALAERSGRTALQAAAEGGHESVVKLLLETTTADVNAAPARDSGRTALQAAAEGGHESVVKLLLETTTADVNAALAERSGRTALQAAAEGGHESVVKLLLETTTADVNAAPARDSGRTALQAAAEGGHESVVKLLLETTTANVNAAPADRSGRTALQAAAGGGHESVVKLLLETTTADVNAAPARDSGRTALQAAAEGGHESVVKLLLEASADVNAAPARYSGRTALQAAAGGGHESVVKLLLETTTADVNAAPARDSGRTALQAAAGGGHESVVKLLLETTTADVNAAPTECSGQTALQAAAEGGHESVVKLLLEASADVNAAPARYSGRTALQAAVEGGHESVVKLLLEASADVNAAPTEYSGQTALQAAAGGGHESVVKLLLETTTADVNAAPAENSGRTALQAAAEGGHEIVVKLLLEASADVNDAPAKYSGQTALQAAAEGGHESVVKLLLGASADVNAAPVESYGRTALQAAAGGGHESVVKLLLETTTADVNAAPAQDSGRTALQAAAEGGHESVVKLLLGASADVNAAPAEYSGRTALQAAAEGGHESVVKLLLGASADVNAAPAEYSGRTALQAAVGGGHESVVKLLLGASADVNAAPAKDFGQTALQAAAEGGHESVVKLLLRASADVNAAPAESYGRTALQAAAGGGHESVVKLLLEASADVNAGAGTRQTALQAAAEGGHESVVKLLLETTTADVNAAPAQDSGRTALQAAVGGGHESVVKLLLGASADVNAAPAKDFGQTALQAAAEGGHESVVKLLLGASADVNAAPAEYSGRTALQAAAEGGHESVVKLLLGASADVNAAPAEYSGRTALQAAVGGGHESVVKLLLEASADVNAGAGTRQTALQAAAEGGHEKIVKLLLDAGAIVTPE